MNAPFPHHHQIQPVNLQQFPNQQAADPVLNANQAINAENGEVVLPGVE